jgi:DNA-binding LacI/PurR family transcriptional regulator
VVRADIHQVAAVAGVSTATVSRVLSGRGPASAHATERVRAAADRLSYAPSARASSLRTDRSMIIGVLVPTLSNPVFLPFLRGVEHRAQDHGYAVIVADSQRSEEVERRQLDRMAAQRIDALIVAGWAPDPDALRRLSGSGLPIVDTGTFADAMGGMAASLGPAIDRACAHLASLGHRTVAVLAGGSAPGGAAALRWRLIERSCRAHGLEADLVLLGSVGDRDPVTTARTLGALVRSPGGPGVLWSSSHPLAAELLEGLAVAGVALPEEVSFLTFGDSPWAAAYRPAISVISGDLGAVAEAMTMAVLHRLGAVESVPDPVLEPDVYRARSSVGPSRAA